MQPTPNWKKPGLHVCLKKVATWWIHPIIFCSVIGNGNQYFLPVWTQYIKHLASMYENLFGSVTSVHGSGQEMEVVNFSFMKKNKFKCPDMKKTWARLYQLQFLFSNRIPLTPSFAVINCTNKPSIGSHFCLANGANTCQPHVLFGS